MNKLLILTVVALAGCSDYVPEEGTTRTYCDMVASGLWPDYQRTYQADCLAGVPR